MRKKDPKARPLVAGVPGGSDFQVFQLKSSLIKTLRNYCEYHSISQRKLASMVAGLTQDRISRIFSGQVNHMSIDKLVQILSILKFKVKVEVSPREL